jgi:hypothetical protein
VEYGVCREGLPRAIGPGQSSGFKHKENAMAEEAKELQCIDWRRCFAFLEIARSFRLAAHPLKLMLCFLGLGLSFAAAVAIDQVPYVGKTDLRVPGIGPVRFDLEPTRMSFYDNAHAIVTRTLWGQWALPYVGGKSWDDAAMFFLAPLNAARDCLALGVAYWQKFTLFALINTILSLAIWAVVGAAVCRMTAVRFAREESVPWTTALRFSFSKWPSTASCVLIPFGVLVLLAIIFNLPAGLVVMVPYVGPYVVGVAMGLALLLNFLLALIFIAGAFSLGLQWPTIAVEGSDAFDAISRSVSYLTSRPWRYLFYTLFSALYGCATFLFVKFLAYLTLAIAHMVMYIFSFGGGPDNALVRLWEAPTLANPWPVSGGPDSGASYLFIFWVWMVLGLAVAFLGSFFFTSQTIIYFLLRKVVDATDTDEVYVEGSEEEELPIQQKAEGPEPAEAGSQAAPPTPPEAPRT